MTEAQIRDAQTDEIVARVTREGIEFQDDIFRDVVGDMVDSISMIWPGEEAGEYDNLVVEPGDRGYVRAVIDEIPSPYTIDDEETLDELPLYGPGEPNEEKAPHVVDLDEADTQLKAIDIDVVPDTEWQRLDDVRFRSYREQVWEEQFHKQMWADSDDVPEFVQRWIDEVVELTDPLWEGGFNNIPHAAALTVHKEITDSLTQPQGWSINSIVGRIVDEFEWLEADDARNIARSEVAAVLNKAREVAFRARPDEVQVDWQGPSDKHTTIICEEIKARIEDEGGSVPIEELTDILYEIASKHTDKGGTPERVDEYLPHHQCRHTMVQV